MTLSVSNIVKPVIKQYLGSLSHLLDEAQKFSVEKGLADEVLLQSRLAPDMHPLIWQFQMVSEFAPRCVSRLAEIDIPESPYVETTFNELKVRIQQAIEYVENIEDAALDAGLQRIQGVPFGPDKTIEFRGPIYLNHFFLPNFFFHITTAYNILRHKGVPLGKLDYVGNIPE
ncbi:MAG: hypothetical protein ACI808_001499 [Paraglaciecola sp.]|jgi:hypothetical protein